MLFIQNLQQILDQKDFTQQLPNQMNEKNSKRKISLFLPDSQKIVEKAESDDQSNYCVSQLQIQSKQSFISRNKGFNRSQIRKMSYDQWNQTFPSPKKRSTGIKSRKNSVSCKQQRIEEEAEKTQQINQEEKAEEKRKNRSDTLHRQVSQMKKNRNFFINTLLQINGDSEKDIEEVIRDSLGQVQKYLCSSDIYVQKNGIWKNRQIICLTTKKLYESAISTITKVKVRKQQPISGYYTFKYITEENSINNIAIRYQDLCEWFCKVCWAYLSERQVFCPINKKFQEKCEGYILKKGQILGNWEKRYVIIEKKEGLLSYRSKDTKPTLMIKETNEVWTRFQLVENSTFMVIKLWYSLIKEEFAFPINNAMEWLGAFVSLIRNEY